MGGIGSGRRPHHKPRVENVLHLDLSVPQLREALDQQRPAVGDLEWKQGSFRRPSRVAIAIGPQGASGRDLVLRFESHDPTQARQIICLERIRFGIVDRWIARCACGRRALKLYLVDSYELRYWRCAGLQYTSAALHDARLDALRGDLRALETAARDRRRPILAERAYRLGMETVRRTMRDLGSRSARRRRDAVRRLGR